MSRPDREVIYPQMAALDDGSSSHPSANTAGKSLAEVVALVHVTMPTCPKSSIRLALVFDGVSGYRLSAIQNGPTVYREATISGARIPPELADRLAEAANAVWATRRKTTSTDAPVHVIADQRVIDAIARWGPRVLLRFLLHRVAAHRLEAPLPSSQVVAGAITGSAAKSDTGRDNEAAA